ncbi:hypothetical protein CC78DRAFT_420801, partial [Lojkania enalia]
SHSQQLSRDQRLWDHTLRDVGYWLQDIVKQPGITYGHAQYAASYRITPKKRPGRSPNLSDE